MATADLYPGLGSFEESHLDELPQNAWLVKPCEVYKEEYSDCKSFKARFHQYFIFGETLDCTQWKTDFDNCMDWRRNRKADSLRKIISSEENRIRQRKLATLANDVWELRDKPPENWALPLPAYLTRDQENSYLALKQKEERDLTHNSEEIKEKNNFCVIS